MPNLYNSIFDSVNKLYNIFTALEHNIFLEAPNNHGKLNRFLIENYENKV